MMQIDHIAIWTDDQEKVKDFYLKYFDCKANAKYTNRKKQFSSYFITFSTGARIELMKRSDIHERDAKDKPGYTHIAINVGARDKVKSVTQKLEKDGFLIDSFPRETGDGYYESVVLDPESNQIELIAMEDYQITEAEHTDLEKILHLQKCCYLSEAEIYDDYSIPPLRQTLDNLKKEWENQIILKLEHNNRIIGSVRGFEKNNTCYIGKLIVDKEYQNMGFGRLLMEAIEGKFKNVTRYELFTGYGSEKNLYLYHKLGYKECKEEMMSGMTIKYLEKYKDR